MKLQVNHISKRLIEVTTEDTDSGLLEAVDAKELAIHLMEVATELLKLAK
jgi:hypothetical protein